MATDTQTSTALLDVAAAIVEAEWMRLAEEDLWGQVADLFAELPALRSRPPRVGGASAWPRRPARQPLDVTVRWTSRYWPVEPVWATQRSPPHGTVLTRGIVEQGR
jgi:hypothetical protein